MFKRTYKYVIRFIEQYLKTTDDFLDVACGTGEILAQVASRYPKAKLTGADFTSAMVDRAITKNKQFNNVHILNANVQRLPFIDHQYDFALCADAFHHFAKPKQALTEISRVIKPGGYFLLVDPAVNGRFVRCIADTFFKRWENANYYFSQSELITLLIEEGFRIVEAKKYSFNNFLLCQKSEA